MDNLEHNQAGQQAGAAAEAGACARAAAAPDASPRIVTTGGNKEPNPITGPESPSSHERVELVSNGNGKVYLRSLPDESVSQDVAHIDWLAFTVTPPEGESPAWLFKALLQFLPILNFTPTGTK